MRNCPFCGKKIELKMPHIVYLHNLNKWTFMHHCNDDVSIFIIKDTKEEIIAEWNGSDQSEKQTSESM